MFNEFIRTMRPIKGRSFWYFFGIIGMTIGNTSIGVVSSVLLREFVDSGHITGMESVEQIAKILVLYVLGLTVLIPVCQYLYNRVAKLAYSDTKKVVFTKILKLPITYFESEHSGKTLSILINDVDKMTSVITGRFRRTFAPFIQIIVYVIPMFIFEWHITLVLILVDLITLYGDILFARKMKVLSKTVQEKLSAMNERLVNIFGGILVVRLFGVDKKLENEYISANGEMSQKKIEKAKVQAMHNAYTFIVSMINTIVFLLCANVLVVLGITTYGSVFGIMSMQLILNESFKSFSQYLPLVYEAFASTKRVYDFLDRPEETPLQMANGAVEGYVTFKDVSFKYESKDEYVLKSFNLQVAKNETVAIVGESGSGKSTIAKLLLGFYPIQSGLIGIDGKRLQDISFEKLRSMISYVPQDAYIFSGTIMENIRYGNLNATDEEVIRAAKSANAYNFIMENEAGFDTLVGERGVKLSGGQRQRIAIARAILKDAPILILDEATASLDAQSEALIKEAIDEARKDKTTIIIAHRLSTIEGADRVIKIA